MPLLAKQDSATVSTCAAIAILFLLIAIIAFAWNVTDLFEGFF